MLPFVNLSADKDQDFFSEGIAEEILDALARVPGLRVPGRASSFLFRGQPVGVIEIGRKLNVGAVLEGSVRKSGNRIRGTAQMSEAAGGSQLWCRITIAS